MILEDTVPTHQDKSTANKGVFLVTTKNAFVLMKCVYSMITSLYLNDNKQ